MCNYTHQSIEEVSTWTLEQIKQVLDLIQQEQQEQNKVELALIDYQILMSREFDKKHQNDARKCQKQAQKIREALTGDKPKRSGFGDLAKLFKQEI